MLFSTVPGRYVYIVLQLLIDFKNIFGISKHKKYFNVFLQEKFSELIDSVEISISVFFSMKDIPNMLQDPANPKVSNNVFNVLSKNK